VHNLRTSPPPKFLQNLPPYFFRGAFAPSFIWRRRPWQAPSWHPLHDGLIQSRRPLSFRTPRNQCDAAGALAYVRRRSDVTRCDGIDMPPDGPLCANMKSSISKKFGASNDRCGVWFAAECRDLWGEFCARWAADGQCSTHLLMKAAACARTYDFCTIDTTASSTAFTSTTTTAETTTTNNDNGLPDSGTQLACHATYIPLISGSIACIITHVAFATDRVSCPRGALVHNPCNNG